jgi:hypothetical protein
LVSRGSLDNDVFDDIGTAYLTACTWIGVVMYVNNDSIIDVVIGGGTLVDDDGTLVDGNRMLVNG